MFMHSGSGIPLGRRGVRRCGLVVAATLLPVLFGAAAAEEVKRLCDFEADADLRAWEFVAGTPRLVPEGASHGASALEIGFDPQGEYHGAYIGWNRVQGDWRGYDALVLDVTNPDPEPIPATVLIADRAWRDGGSSYWNRHNAAATFAPGKTRWVIATGGLYRGEAGSRNNDIKRNIDVDGIVRVDFGFGAKGAAGRVIIDDLRLVKVAPPAGVWAFDFGPADQSVALGWTGVSEGTRYDKDRGHGWGPRGGTPWKGAARDTTFGPALIRDFCEAGGYDFRVDVPAGRHLVTVIFENSGYWGGEQARNSKRSISVAGRNAWSEDRPDGAATVLYRFEGVEPVGRDVWDTYMAPELARPVTFTAEAGQDGLTLHFESDAPGGSRISALLVHRADDEAAATWRADQMRSLADEFRGLAVCLDAPASPFEPPVAWRGKGLVVWPVALDDEVVPTSSPPGDAPAPGGLTLSARAARGETVTFCLAARAVAAPVACDFAWDTHPRGTPPAVRCRQVWYEASRGFNSLAYRIRGKTVRPLEDGAIACLNVTRELVITVAVPVDAAPGTYRGTLRFAGRGQAGPLVEVPVSVTVSPVVLDRSTEFRMGFFGVEPPDLLPPAVREQRFDQTLAMLREYGMNMVCGGPAIALTGWKDGQPVLDFRAADAFFAALKRHGFTGPVSGYGGLRISGLHTGYEPGPDAAAVEQASGLRYDEALMRAWRAVDAHARATGWPTIWYAMCDETRVRDVAERELEFMRLMGRASAAFPATVRTSGFSSVSFRTRPTDPSDLLGWHQKFFAALDISELNEHDETVLEEAARLGREIHLYNQGASRYSFGLYQWSAFRRGIKARTEWHLAALHGYQFFDLDGREPDVAMLCYGRDALHPTLTFERCRVGAQDFHLYDTLSKAVAAAKAGPAGQAGAAERAAALAVAERLLAGLSVPLNQRQAPAGFRPDAVKAEILTALETLVR